MKKDHREDRDVTLPKLVIRYLNHIEIEKNYSKYTIRNYHHYLDFFRRWFEKNYQQEYIRRLTNEMVRNYRIYLSRFQNDRGEHLSPITQSYYIITLRAFLKYLIRKGYKALSPEKIDLPKIDDRSIKFLNEDMLYRLLDQPGISSIEGLRDKAILEVLFSTGMRVSELAKLDREKIDLKTKEFGIIGKGRKARVVFLNDRAVKWLGRFLGMRNDHYKPLWIRYSGKHTDPSTAGESLRLSVRGIQRIVEKYRKKAGVPIKVTPHVIRHSFATTLLQRGADLRSVQEMLGHKNVSTTQIYTHVTNPQLKKVHEKYLG